MLNEPVQEAGQGSGGGGGGGGGGVGVTTGTGGLAEAGGGHMNYIQVTPQEKEAIERVRQMDLYLKYLTYIRDQMSLSMSC